jgi:hypothetical protein
MKPCDGENGRDRSVSKRKNSAVIPDWGDGGAELMNL